MLTERDLLISMNSPVAAEAERLRRKVKKCEEVLKFTEGWRKAIEADPTLAESRYGAGAIKALTNVARDLTKALE